MDAGVRCVMMNGMAGMPKWFVTNWDMLVKVSMYVRFVVNEYYYFDTTITYSM